MATQAQVLARVPAAEILGALGGLAPEYRQALYLVDIEGFSYRQAAVLMGTQPGTVMSRLHSGRVSLVAQLMALAPAV